MQNARKGFLEMGVLNIVLLNFWTICTRFEEISPIHYRINGETRKGRQTIAQKVGKHLSFENSYRNAPM